MSNDGVRRRMLRANSRPLAEIMAFRGLDAYCVFASRLHFRVLYGSGKVGWRK